MMRQLSIVKSAIALSLFFLPFTFLNAAEQTKADYSLPKALKKEVKVRTDQAVTYLKGQQKNGKWLNSPGVTALCLQAMFTSPRKYDRHDGPWMRKPIEYLMTLQQKDGAIYDPKSRKPTKNYCTALSVVALAAAQDDYFKSTIQRATKYLIDIQADEGEEYDPKKDYFYGGIGYGGDQRPDLSNLQLALDAIHDAGIDKDHEVYKRALIFINRCQDAENNDQKWAKGSGGFAYSPDVTSNQALPVDRQGREVMPYGSMTFAGLKSLIFCNVDKNDPRVKDALKWISKNFSVESHPGMGQISLYYYYYTMAKSLSVAGIDEIKLDNGKSVHWKEELAKELLKRQKPDGSWVNKEKKYMEGVSVLATAYALNTLNIIYK